MSTQFEIDRGLGPQKRRSENSTGLPKPIKPTKFNFHPNLEPSPPVGKMLQALIKIPEIARK